MPFSAWLAQSTLQLGAVGFRALEVSRESWRQVAQDAAARGGRLLALWAGPAEPAGARIHAAYQAEHSGLIVTLRVGANEPWPALDDLFPAAARMQRAVTDLSGLPSTAADTRPWLRHAAWAADYHPLADTSPRATGDQPPFTHPLAAPHVAHEPASARPHVERPASAHAHAAHAVALSPDAAESSVDDYAFVRVAGDGVHEIPVGPVHAGIIEPGHFRFSVVGEKVLRLEERLGYVHKGIERRFTELPALEGHRLAARVSGDSAVAFSWAYCQALEALSGCTIPPRAALLRALCLEIERIQNHLGDLGALGNDAGFAFGLAQFSRLKEYLLRAVDGALGQRYLLDAIVPGGTRMDLSAEGARALAGCVAQVAGEARKLQGIYDEHPGVRDRFVGAGQVSPQLARTLGLIGLAGRASGQAFDARVDLPSPPYDALVPTLIVRTEGDVAARVAVRFEELQESCRLIALLLEHLPGGEHRAVANAPLADTLAVGLIEGWRGPVLVALEADAAGAIRRCHPHDPSWQNWPVLEYAIIGNIVPDFPLINKSFNLSYSGHDL